MSRWSFLKLNDLKHGMYYYGKGTTVAVARWDDIKRMFFFWKWRDSGNTLEPAEYGVDFRPVSVVDWGCKKIPLENE